MKFFNCVVVVLIFALVIACKKENQKIDISGDWYTIQFLSYTLDSLTDNQIDFAYREDYFKDSLVFTYMSSMGYVSPSKFYIRKDSLYSVFGIESYDYNFKGKIKMVSDNHFVLYDDLFKVNYYRLIDTSELLSKYIIDLDTDNPKINDPNVTFGRVFRKRINNRYAQILDTISK